jgi:hypothetical protein
MSTSQAPLFSFFPFWKINAKYLKWKGWQYLDFEEKVILFLIYFFRMREVGATHGISCPTGHLAHQGGASDPFLMVFVFTAQSK